MHDEPRPRRATAAVAAALMLCVVAVPAAAAPARDGDALTAEQRAWVEDNPAIRVGWFAGSPPVSVWVDGELQGGYAVQLFDLMEVKVGVEFEHVLFPDIPAVVEALRNGEIDIAGTQGARPDLLEFAEPTLPTAWERLVFVGDEEQVELGLDDLEGRTATTIGGSPLEQTLLSEFPELEYVPTATLPDGLVAVDRGEIDLYLAPLAVVGAMLVQGAIDVAPVGERVDLIPIYAWGRPDSPATGIVQTARELVTDEELALIHVRWTGFDLGDPAASRPPWLLPGILGALAVLMTLGGFALLLRRRVRTATAELRRVNAELEERVEARTAELAASARHLEASNEALSRFAHATAHDLRNPLVAMSGLAELATSMDLGVAEQEEALRSIGASSRRALGMVTAMLREAEAAGVATPWLTAREYQQWLQESTAAEQSVERIELTVDVPDDERLDVDTAVLQRTTTNLVTNAVKYADSADGTRIAVRLRAEGGMWRLTVDDNGPGIPEDRREAIFERGARLHGDDRGLGMGLAEVRELLDRVGGVIRVSDSDLGGASFSVDLPRQRSTG